MKNVWGVLIVVVVLLLLAVAFVLSAPYAHQESWRKVCNSNLGQIVKACTTYQEPNGDYFPAFWDGDRFDPMKSLAMLYPAYLDNPRVFACPSTRDRTEITVTIICEKDVRCSFGPVDTRKKCNSFYDERANYRTIPPNQAIACDADGQTWRDASGKPPPYPANWTRKPRKPNHDNGQNVMYFDGHVKWWTETVCSSADPRDNIFCPTGDAAGPWDPDTNAYLWDGVNARAMEMVK